jgi:hypothetical protein
MPLQIGYFLDPFLFQVLSFYYVRIIYNFVTGRLHTSSVSCCPKSGEHTTKRTSPESFLSAPEIADSSLPHRGFRKSLRGQQAQIPNLYTLFPEWTPRLHREYKRARNEVLNPWLNL